MNLQSLQKRYGDFYSPRFRVVVDGEAFTEGTGLISDLEVDTTLDGADRFSFTLNYRFDHESATFVGLDWKQFATGKPVEIFIGYGDALGPKPAGSGGGEGTPLPALVGTISTVSPTFPASGSPTVKISGYGPLHDLTKGSHEYSWKKTTLETVVDQVTGNGRPKLKPQTSYSFRDRQISGAELEQRQIIQEKQHDMEFLRQLGEKFGFELFTMRGEFHFRPKNPTRTPRDPVVTLRYGESLTSFSPETNDAEQVGAVEVRAWNEVAKKEIVGRAEMGDGSGGTRVFRIPVESKTAAEEAARSRLASISRARVQGSGETIGLPELIAGERIRLEGVDRYTGEYFVTSAAHRLGSSGYATSFSVTEDAR